WLKSYLDLGPNHPIWAAAADAIIAHHTPVAEENVDFMQRTNIFLQTWKASTARLPDDLKVLLKAAQKYNVRLDGLALSRDILRKMPIWYHTKSEATRRMFNSGEQVKCLKIRHKIKTVGDAEKLAWSLGGNRHTQRGKCSCEACKYAQEQVGCKSPCKCFQKAKNMLDSLPLKWNPLSNSPAEVMGDEAEELEGDIRIFIPHLVTTGSLADMFRIFAEEDECPNTYNPQQETTPLDEMTMVYTDGSAIKCRTEDATASAGIFYGEDDPRNRSIWLLNEVGRTNQVSEMIGA
ncbi:hypothetical protein EDD85DRAFT_754994, partial [Armillaria nabsnona]